MKTSNFLLACAGLMCLGTMGFVACSQDKNKEAEAVEVQVAKDVKADTTATDTVPAKPTGLPTCWGR